MLLKGGFPKCYVKEIAAQNNNLLGLGFLLVNIIKARPELIDDCVKFLGLKENKSMYNKLDKLLVVINYPISEEKKPYIAEDSFFALEDLRELDKNHGSQLERFINEAKKRLEYQFFQNFRETNLSKIKIPDDPKLFNEDIFGCPLVLLPTSVVNQDVSLENDKTDLGTAGVTSTKESEKFRRIIAEQKSISTKTDQPEKNMTN